MLSDSRTDLNALNEKQKEAVISDDKRLLVLAGAGSGKTKTLLQKLVYLIEEKQVSPSAILAVTFTRNAANEMIDRLILSADPTGTYEAIMVDKFRSRSDKDAERIHWRRRFKWIDGLTIRTFHGFCYNVLRNHGVNEFDNKFRIIGEEKRDEEDELSRHVAPETVYEVFHKILIQAWKSSLCQDVREHDPRLGSIQPYARQDYTKPPSRKLPRKNWSVL